MTFADLKIALLAAAKPLEICDAFFETKVAADYHELIEAGLRTPVWIYQSGVLTDALLGEIPESEMNDRGIYTTGSFSISDPDLSEIYLFKDAVVTLTLSGNKKLKVIIQGAATIDATLTDNAHLHVVGYNTAGIDVDCSNESSVCIDATDENVVAVTLNDDSCGHITATGDSSGTVTADDDSVARISTFQHAAFTYTQHGASVFYNRYLQKSVINPSGV